MTAYSRADLLTLTNALIDSNGIGGITAADLRALLLDFSNSVYNTTDDSAPLPTLTDSHLFVGNSSNVATSRAITGDVTIGNTGVTAIGAGKVTGGMLGAITSSELKTALTDETGSGALVFATSPTLTTPILGVPTSGTLTTCTGLPISTGVSGLAAGVASFLATPSSANLATAITDETGTGALVFGSAPTITGGTITGLTGQAAVASGKAGTLPWMPYKSGKFYTAGNLASTATATNTTPLVNDTVYTALGLAAAPVAIKSISFRTSSSNAGTTASVKIGIYAADGVNGTPGTLLGSTASGTSITDSATSTDFTINLDSVANVPAGPFWIGILQTSATGIRTAILSGVVPYLAIMGSTSATGVLGGGTVIYGFTVAQAYASGMPSPFGTAVANTSNGLNPHFVFEIN